MFITNAAIRPEVLPASSNKELKKFENNAVIVSENMQGFDAISKITKNTL